MLDVGTCRVWFARRADGLEDGLSPLERARWGRWALAADRERFATGSSLARVALRDATRVPGAELGRTCGSCGARDHGPVAPVGVDDSFSLSVTHSGDAVAVCVGRGVGQVGLDVEEGRGGLERAAHVFASAAERRADDRAACATSARLVRWVRKEAILKATRVGLTAPPHDLEVSGAGVPAAVVAWADASRPAGIATGDIGCRDLDGAPIDERYRAALAWVRAGEGAGEIAVEHRVASRAMLGSSGAYALRSADT